MRNADQIRERAVTLIGGMLLRPSMYGIGSSLEFTIRAQLQDLAFIDAREAELERLFDDLRARALFGPLGCWGVLNAALGAGDFTDEVASVYARVASHLGYFEPSRRLPSSDLASAVRDAPTWGKATRRCPADMLSRFGPPSYCASSAEPSVYAYAGPTDETWLYFDFSHDSKRVLEHIRIDARHHAHTITDLREAGHSSVPEDVYRRFLIAMLSGDRNLVVTFHGTGVGFIGYPYAGSSVRGLGFVSWSEVRDADPHATPPELRLRSGEILAIPALFKTALERALSARSIPAVRRPDVWALLLEPFLDTAFDESHRQYTLERLAELGFAGSEVSAIRQRIRERMLAYNAVHWDWVHLGLFDLLDAHSSTFFGWFGQSKEFYAWAMEIASRGDRSFA